MRQGDVIAKVRIIPDLVNLNNAEGRLERANIAYEDAKMNFDRQEKLFNEGVIAAADFQQARLPLKMPSRKSDAAEANLELIREGVNKKSGKMTNTLINSTIDGMILDVPVKVGKLSDRDQQFQCRNHHCHSC